MAKRSKPKVKRARGAAARTSCAAMRRGECGTVNDADLSGAKSCNDAELRDEPAPRRS